MGPLTWGYPDTGMPVPVSGNTSYVRGAKLKTSSLQPAGRAGAVQLIVRVVLVAFTRVASGRESRLAKSGARHSMPVCVCVCVCRGGVVVRAPDSQPKESLAVRIPPVLLVTLYFFHHLL